ncbi:MAG TPA: S1C family serine protease [Gemmataceae bacterium]|nr:S1C family serine protease [Gemmataceae bacterium]
MIAQQRLGFSRHVSWVAGLILACALPLASGSALGESKGAVSEAATLAVLEKSAPENVDDLKAIETQVQAVLQKVLPCTVGVRAGGAWGSGVLIREDGYVLTAGHVSAEPGREVLLILMDGRRVKGKTLGANRGIDSGLIKITEDGTWPFAPMGNSADLKPGEWCIATGHPGGYKTGRTPVVRLGRVLNSSSELIQTDCTLVGGDSGGPLFDLHGRVIGIHSRIGGPLTANIHVPVDTYRNTWERLAKAEIWGSRLDSRGRSGADFGLQVDSESKDCRISEVVSGGPADKAGFKVDDVITRFGGQKIANTEDFVAEARGKRPGNEVSVEVLRGEKTITLKLVVGRREGRPFGPPPN